MYNENRFISLQDQFRNYTYLVRDNIDSGVDT